MCSGRTDMAGSITHAGGHHGAQDVGFQELSSSDMMKFETKNNHNAAKAGTIFGSVAAGIAILLLVGARKRS
ncbi:hypothetical protein GCM10027167_37480 [Nocardia heshunensis]